MCRKNSWLFNTFSFESKLPEIFRDIHEAHQKIDARLKAEQFKVWYKCHHSGPRIIRPRGLGIPLNCANFTVHNSLPSIAHVKLGVADNWGSLLN